MTIKEVLELCANGKAEDLVLPVRCIDCKYKDNGKIRGNVFCYMTGTCQPYYGYCYLGEKETEQVYEYN